METFLHALEPYSDAQVERACAAMMRRNSPFPPSAGELAHECGRTVVYAPDPEKLIRFRAQGEPVSRRSDEERAASRARVQAMYDAWRAQLPASDDKLVKSVGKMVGASAENGPVRVGDGLQAFFTQMMPDEPPPPADKDEDDDAPQF